MKIKSIQILTAFTLIATLLSGCFSEINKVYDGPPVVEFAQYDQPFSPSNNWVSTVTFAADTETGSVDISLLLQLVAPHFDSDTHIGFQVVNEQLDEDGEVEESTTAVEGTHYEVLTGNNQAVFPANSSLSSIDLNLIADNLDPGDSVQFIIQLTESDALTPSENYKYYRVVVQKAEVSDDD